jgi:SpoIID/LytB domain protein
MAVLPAGIAHANNGDQSSATATPPAPRHVDGAGRGASDTMVFYGSGWGHGVGMSQWGANGLAQQGWSATRILEHYYSHTNVTRAPAGSPTQIRVGLTQGRSVMHLTAQGGPVALRFGSPTNADKFVIPKGSTWTVSPDPSGHFRVVNARGHAYDPVGGPKWKMFAVYAPNHAQLRIPEAGHAYGRGIVEFNSYKVGGWTLRAIAVLGPNEYLDGLGEVPNYWPTEALKVQAVAGRTYAFHVIQTEHHGNQHLPGCNCGVYPDSRDQSYLGWDKEAEQGGNRWVQAVNQTDGQVVLYRGHLILANYYSTSGGFTENVENVWFGNPVAYLRGVCDPGDYSAPVGLRTWRESLTRSQVGNALGVGTLSSLSGISRSHGSGRLIHITANGGGGLRGSSRRLTGPQFSAALGLMDDKVWINTNRNIEGAIRGRYDALMCRPGLAMSSSFSAGNGSVQRFANGSIFQNPRVQRASWLHGDVYDKYLAIGGAGSVLGLPTTGVVTLLRKASACTGGRCTRASFDRGRIYDKAGNDPHELHGAVLGYYVGQDGPGGPLGFPTSDIKHLAHATIRATFEHGVVTCDGAGSCTKA